MQKIHIKAFAIALSLLLVACGGGGSAVATSNPTPTVSLTPQQQIAALEANGALPKLDRSTSLAGLDVDANGVRDDVDTYIVANYTNLTERGAATQLASIFQSVMLVDTDDIAAVRAISNRSSRATHCIYIMFKGGNESKQPSFIAEEIESISINTKIRLLKYLSYAKALNGSVMILPKGNTCE